MLGEQNRQQQRPPGDIPWLAIQRGGAVLTAVSEEEDEGGAGDAAEPRQEAEGVEPGADRVGAPGDRALAVGRDLHGVGARLDPVVGEEGAGGERPDDREEGEVAWDRLAG